MAAAEKSSSLFVKQKHLVLNSVDLSRKGSIDEPIIELIKLINCNDSYFSLSSCSGRLLCVDNQIAGAVQKKGCNWLMVSHDKIQVEDLIKHSELLEGNAVFKFEPFVLHVQCKTLKHAQNLHAVAVESGFRNSGITVSNKGKIVAAVRSTHSMEVPLSKHGRLLVSTEYLEFIAEIANSKMDENLVRIERFYENFKAMLNRSETASENKHSLRDERKTCKNKRQLREKSPGKECIQDIETGIENLFENDSKNFT
ncbi:tRNA wybutosine-synthesizing protein 3 homolog [Tubulanus polymorphus]|uniref:tRNA wybutosine-synthesizing protein 3 homolog n=1 Tax=Tubulanus polymorphus TaxID=672921 RepID=UPI003DA431D6